MVARDNISTRRRRATRTPSSHKFPSPEIRTRRRRATRVPSSPKFPLEYDSNGGRGRLPGPTYIDFG